VLQKGIRGDSRRLSRRALEPPLTQAGLPDARSTPESRRCAQHEAVRSPGAGDTVMSTLEESSAGVAFKEPKTARGARTIALPEITVEALREHRKAQCEMRLRVGPASRVTTLVFPGADGEPWWPSNFARASRRVFKKAGLSSRLHDLRHTHATMLLRQGVHPKVVQERLGHANVSITLDIYSHCTANMQQEAAAKIDEALRGVLVG